MIPVFAALLHVFVTPFDGAQRKTMLPVVIAMQEYPDYWMVECVREPVERVLQKGVTFLRKGVMEPRRGVMFFRTGKLPPGRSVQAAHNCGVGLHRTGGKLHEGRWARH